MARPAWLVLGALNSELTGEAAPQTAAEAFAGSSQALPAFGGLTYADLGTKGALANAQGAVAASSARASGV